MIEILYSSVGIIVAAGYLPQITKLITAARPCHEISVAAWSMWAYTSFVSLIYSLYGQEIYDAKFMSVNAVNTACIAMIIGVTLYKRQKYKTAPVVIDPLPSEAEVPA